MEDLWDAHCLHVTWVSYDYKKEKGISQTTIVPEIYCRKSREHHGIQMEGSWAKPKTIL